MKLSIIIPAYNAEPYIYELIDCLEPQMNDDVEVIVIDDGSKKPFKTDKEWVNVYRKKNGGVSSARNMGIEKSIGEYISFIDADDLVSEDYVKQIFSKIPFDFLEMSWKSLPGGIQYSAKLNTEHDRLRNPSACTRAFSRKFIGDIRFNENKDSAEDEDFTRRLDLSRGKCAVVTDYLYFYRTDVENSGSKRSMRGETDTMRIVYHYNHITSDMRHLVKEIQEEDLKNEVIVMTNQCDIPEIKKYAQVISPSHIRGMELRGEHTPLFQRIQMPIKTQICLYKHHINEIGGIESFIYYFVRNMAEYYDITILYDLGESRQIARLRPYVRVVHDKHVVCDTLIMNSIMDDIPKNVSYKKCIQMVHCCKVHENWTIPDRDLTVNVSKISRNSFRNKGEVIHNMTYKDDVKKSLLLVTASRVDSSVKGAKRMIQLANLLNQYKIPFVWLYFSNKEIQDCPKNLIRMDSTLDIRGWMQKADYVVQLSDVEAYCYTIVEALELGIPVITTPIDVLPEIGFKEFEHGFIVPYNMDLSFDDIQDIYNAEFDFNYENDTEDSIAKWRKILGNKKPKHDYVYDDSDKKVVVIIPYRDIQLNRFVEKNEILMVKKDRAEELEKRGLIEIL